MGRVSRAPLTTLILATLLAACGGEDQTARDPAAWEALGITRTEAELDAQLAGLENAPLDPPPVVGRDYAPVFPPPVAFDPAAWTTNTPSPSVAEPEAIKGGRIRLSWLSWPPTLRTEGPNSRLSQTSNLQDLVYETLLEWDPALGDFAPGLATHWQVGPDHQTFRFRLDPEARWSDGRRVTADDVVATIEHLQNPDRRDPYYEEWRTKIREAKVIDELTVEIRAREPKWRTLLEVGSMWIYPAAYIRMDGETYLDAWNWKLPPGSGPYALDPEDIRRGRSVTMRRRPDWWRASRPAAAGIFNFDAIVWEVVLDDELTYQKTLAGELDVYVVGAAQRWVEELDRETKIRQGWIQKRRIFNLNPEGIGGFCFNLREAPFDRRGVRLAFAHLFNREQLFAKFFYGQYEMMDSYFPGQKWARPDAEPVRYDPRRARELLAEEGYSSRDASGHLVDEKGKRFPDLIFEFDDPGWERIFAVVVRDLWNEAGIRLELRFIDFASLMKKQWEYRYTVTWMNWTEGLFPDPRSSYHSDYADVPQTNNGNGFKDPEADAIMDAYQLEFDAAERERMLQRLDAILFDAHLYALAWYAPHFRIIYWDRFGHPPEYGGRYRADVTNILRFWWYDPDRDARMRANMNANRGGYPDRPLNQEDDTEIQYWLDHERPGREMPR